MENHYRELLRFLSARLGDRQAAADVAHDAYLRVLERSSQARIEHPRAFLYRTALNLAVDEHRRSRVRKAEPLHVLDEEEGMSEPSPPGTRGPASAPRPPDPGAERTAAAVPRVLPPAQAGRSFPQRDSGAPEYLPQSRGKAHRQCDEALPPAHASLGVQLIQRG